jgi:hypothetical protein
MGDGFDHLDTNLHALGMELTTSVLQGGSGFCGVNVQEYAINGVTYGWKRGSRLKIAVDFDDLGALRSNQVKEIIEAQINQIRAVTDGITFDLFTPTLSANIVCKLARLDGPNGVLADCQIPQPNASPDNTQLLMRIDTGEVWGYFTSQRINGIIDFGRTWLHEFLHGIGLGHQPASIQKPAIIQAMYNPLLWLLQDTDKSEIVRRYGGAAVKPAPAPVPPPLGAPSEIPVVVTAKTQWGEYRASGPLKPVAKQAIYTDRYPTGPIRYMREDFDTDDEQIGNDDPTDIDTEGELS